MTSAQIAARHLLAHGAIVLVALSDLSQVVDCKCGAPLGVFTDDHGIDWTADDDDIEAYAR
jgi:hypothetical protein